jgi:hypothetical protein
MGVGSQHNTMPWLFYPQEIWCPLYERLDDRPPLGFDPLAVQPVGIRVSK